MKKNDIIKNIKERLGIEQLNEMQTEMAATDDRDIILLAPTGSGKTLAFTIRMLRNIDAGVEGLSAVVIAPSRELVIQIGEVVRSVASGLKTVVMYGGHPMSDEINSLAVTPSIIISTPGRFVDHLNRGTLHPANVKSIVLDEYDKSLELGFADEMKKILKRIRRPSLKMLTSATALDELPEFIGDKQSFHIFNFIGEVVAPEATTELIAVESPGKDKLDTLSSLLRSMDNDKVIVFVNHRESAERVYQRLKRDGFPVGLYHGGLDQQERRLAVDMLDNGSTPILVSTDLASRGLDLESVGAVVHYHLPLSEETWKHRNGRTARQGAQGRVYAILSPGESLPFDANADKVLTDMNPSDNPIRANRATLYFNAGKKEKISKGDIAGFLIRKGGLDKDEVGRIVVDDHSSIAAVPIDKAGEVLVKVSPERLKGKRVKISRLSR